MSARDPGGRKPFIWDVHGQEVIYDLDAPQGVKKSDSLWDEYNNTLKTAQDIISRQQTTLPAYAGICKLCQWYSTCKKLLIQHDDLTLIPELGSSKRNVMLHHIKSREQLVAADLVSLIQDKKTIFPGIGKDTLIKFKERAKLQKTPAAKPFLKTPIILPHGDCELFFDVETDPMRDICYLHGFLERRHRDNKTEVYTALFADNPTEDDEKKAFKDALAYIQKRSPCVLYYYSHYERTTWKKLQKKISSNRY